MDIKNKKMKFIKSILTLILISSVSISCSDSSDDPIAIDENPLEGYHLLERIQANGHIVEIHSEQQGLVTGYNELFLRIKEGDRYVSDAELSWNPLMHMTTMVHSAPKSPLTTTSDKTVHHGHLIFQMPGNEVEYWELELQYAFGGKTYQLSQQLEVWEPADGNRTVNVFTGTDGVRYILAMMPLSPKVAINDFSARLYKMENMLEFLPVEGYRIALDPRMPGMGNHGSPNNVDLTYDDSLKQYTGKLSLTMTGYWKVNLKLLNAADQVLGGEDVTDDNQQSSLFFELEF